MPRQPRYRLAGIPQHLRARGHNGEAVFLGTPDYRMYHACMVEAAAELGAAIHAYALLPDCVHLLATPADPEGISRLVQSIGRRYGQYFNAAHGRRGTLWDGRYRASLVEPTGYLVSSYCYIEFEPVQAGLTANAGEYEWSSFHANGLGRPDAAVTAHPMYRSLGATPAQRRQRYVNLFDMLPNPRIYEVLTGAIDRGLVFGSERFKDRIESQKGARARPGRPGRPPKHHEGAEVGDGPGYGHALA